MNFQIDRGIPIPPRRKGAHTGLTKALRLLSIGERVVVHDKTKLRSIRVTVGTLKREESLHFVVREIPEGVGIWRVLEGQG
jgi:hypothetical protein